MTTKRDLDERLAQLKKAGDHANKKKDDRDGCPKKYRCAWKFQKNGEMAEGTSDWTCFCRAVFLAMEGCWAWGRRTHWVEVQSDQK